MDIPFFLVVSCKHSTLLPNEFGLINRRSITLMGIIQGNIQLVNLTYCAYESRGCRSQPTILRSIPTFPLVQCYTLQPAHSWKPVLRSISNALTTLL